MFIVDLPAGAIPVPVTTTRSLATSTPRTAATAKSAAVPRMSPTILPESLTIRADTFDATDLARLTPGSLRASAKRLIVVGLAEVSDVRAAATRLGIEVVARVDRTQIGSGQSGDLPWMIFSPEGGQPRVAELQGQFTPMSPDFKRVLPKQLSEDVFTSSYHLLGKVNPGRANGGENTTNCVLAAIATDLTLKEQGVRGDADYGTWYFATPPETQWSRKYLGNYRGQDPVEVAGYYSIVNAMLTAGVGARGMVVVSVGGKKFDHAFNVVHDDDNGVVFLDGQTGRQADLPANFQSLQFLPTSDHFPHHAIDVSPTPGPRNAFLRGSGPEFERFWQVSLPLPDGEDARYYWKKLLAVNRRHDIRVEVEQKLYFRGTDGIFYLDENTAADAGIEEGEWGYTAIIEDVAGPLRTLDEESDYPPVDPVFDETQRTEGELERRFAHGRGSPAPLDEIFRPEDGWELTDLGRESSIGPAAIGESTGVHVHHSQGVPLAGLAEILDRVREGSYPERATDAVNRDAMTDGQKFGKELAGRFVRWWATQEGRQLAPSLDAETLAEQFLSVPKVRALWGVAALAYIHAASIVNAYLKRGRLKRNFDVISRNDLSALLDGLEQDVRDYLDSDIDYALDDFRRRHENRAPNWREHYFDEQRPFWRPSAEFDILDLRVPQLDDETINDYLLAALLQNYGTRIGQADVLQTTSLNNLDDHSGRLSIPQAVIEIRHFGAERVDVETARKHHKELAEIARREYAAVVEWESSPTQSEQLEDLWQSVQRPRERPQVFVHAEDADAAATPHLERALGFLLEGGHADALINSRVNAAREKPWNRGEVNRLATRLRAAITDANEVAVVTEGPAALAALYALDRHLMRFNQAARNAEIDGLRPRQSDGDPVLPYELKDSKPLVSLPQATAVLNYMLAPGLRRFIRKDALSAKKRKYQPNRPPEDQRQRVRDARDALLNGIDQAILDFSHQELADPGRLNLVRREALERRAQQLVLLGDTYNQVIIETTRSTQDRARLGRRPHVNPAMFNTLGDLAFDALKDFKGWQPYENRFSETLQRIGTGTDWLGPTREQLQNARNAVHRLVDDATAQPANAHDWATTDLIPSVERIRRAFYEFQRLLLNVE